MNVLPRPGSLVTAMSPPIMRQSRRESASPSPVPPYFFAVEASAWAKSWKSRPICSSVMPMPVSATSKTISSAPRAGAHSRRTASDTVPPSVNLQALERRLKSVWRTLVWSARISPTSGAQAIDEGIAPAVGQRPDDGDDLLDQRRHREPLEVDVHLARLDLREVEDGVDQLEQVLARGVDLAEVGDEAGLPEVLRLLLQHLGVADDGVERRAQLVGHAGEELRLVAVGHLELAEEARVLDGQRRLRGEGAEQVDGLRREVAGGVPAHDEAAHQVSFAQHGHREQRPHPGLDQGARAPGSRRRPRA